MSRIFLASLLFMGLSSFVAVADDASADPLDIALLIKDLDSPKFDVRRRASQQLHEMGKSVFKALEEASKSESREAATRSIDILKDHFQNGDDETKAAAKTVLERIAASDTGRATRLAKQALKPKKDPQPADPFGPGGANPFGGRVQIQVRAVAGNNRNMKVKIVNGVKEIEVEENGRKIKINEDPNNGIKIEVTEKINGKEVTKKYEAKNADDLKKNHPEGHKIYEKYGKGGGVIQFRVGAKPFKIQPGQIPAIPQPAPNQNGAIEKSKQRIQEMIDRYKKKLEQTPADAEQLKQVIERLEKHLKQIDDVQKRLQDIQKNQNDARQELEKQRKQIQDALKKPVEEG